MTTKEVTTSNELSKELKESNDSKQNRELIDDCFYVEQKKYGLWYSTDKDGKGLITSLTKEQCVSATRFYLKGRQEGFSETKTYDGQVGGKL